jgi:hypothetical protein
MINSAGPGVNITIDGIKNWVCAKIEVTAIIICSHFSFDQRLMEKVLLLGNPNSSGL